MKLNFLLLLLFPFIMAYGQPAFTQKKFTGIVCKVYINYEARLSVGEYVYVAYNILPGKDAFTIEGKMRNNIPYGERIPYTKQEQKKTNPNSIINLNMFLDVDRYYSEKETYTVNGKAYQVYKHINYNCYDLLCGSKHGHMPYETGETWFSPDYGILISFHGREYDVLQHISEVTVPYELIIAIMKANKFPDKIIQQYKSDATGG